MEIQRLDSAVEIPRHIVDNMKEQDVVEENTSPPPSSDFTPPTTETPASRLLALPAELQLAIWEFAVTSPSPLNVNCPCDSSFNGWTSEYHAERERWENGTLQPPWQPSLTRVCRSIRADALPLFYKLNSFQAGYCYETDMDIVVDWLRLIGNFNRMALREFFFFDANGRHDVNCENDLKRVLRGAVVREFGGRLESRYEGGVCRHDVVFGVEEEEWQGVVLEVMFREEGAEGLNGRL